MKIGKMILGAAGLVLAIASAFAFKATHKSGIRYYGTNKSATPAIGCIASTCFEPTGIGNNPVCHSLMTGRLLSTIYTEAGNCVNRVFNWTTNSL